MISSDLRDAVVVGGGVVGSAIAWRCARAGIEVTLVDPEPVPASTPSASWAAAGLLAPVTEAHYGEEDLLTLNLESARRYRSFVAELEADSERNVGYRACGTVVAARDADDVAALSDLLAFQTRLGLEVTRLRADDLRQLEPNLSPRLRGGLLVEGDHQIDNRALLEALQSAVVARGGRIVAGRVLRVLADDGRVSAVELDNGASLTCDAVVVAAGVWSPSIEGAPPEAIPAVRPVKGQLLHLRGRAFLQHNVRGLDVYIVPRADGRVAVGATMEERGIDLTRTAEAAYELLRDAYELVPGLLELELVEHAVGLRPTTPDNAPAIGPTSVDGLYVATGHFRNGVLLAPVTADSIAALLQGRSPDVDLEAFDPRRFGATRLAS